MTTAEQVRRQCAGYSTPELERYIEQHANDVAFAEQSRLISDELVRQAEEDPDQWDSDHEDYIYAMDRYYAGQALADELRGIRQARQQCKETKNTLNVQGIIGKLFRTRQSYSHGTFNSMKCIAHEQTPN